MGGGSLFELLGLVSKNNLSAPPPCTDYYLYLNYQTQWHSAHHSTPLLPHKSTCQSNALGHCVGAVLVDYAWPSFSWVGVNVLSLRCAVQVSGCTAVSLLTENTATIAACLCFTLQHHALMYCDVV